MGRGGGSSGGHSGGGHSSGGSHGGSYRSSGSSGSRGGFSSGGRSVGSYHSSSHRPSGYSSGPAYRPPSTHIHYHTGPGAGYYGRAARPRRSVGVSTVVAIVVIWFAIAILFTMIGSSASGITKSTIDREPLSKQYGTFTGSWFEDNIGWIRSPAKVEQGLKYFYDKTGVIPYLVLIEDINGNYNPGGQACWDYGEMIYQRMFNDEAHMVFVFQCRDESDVYNMAAVTGAQAKTVLDDSEALEILYDYFDSYFWSDRTDDEMFADAFHDAADRIMKKTPNYTFIVVIAVVIVIGLVVAFFIIKEIHRRKKEAAEETERILNTPVDRLE